MNGQKMYHTEMNFQHVFVFLFWNGRIIQMKIRITSSIVMCLC